MTPARPRPVAAFYHRPMEGTFHGGSLHFKAFIERLRGSVPVAVVAPPYIAANEQKRNGDQPGPLLVGFRYLVTSAWVCARFLWSDGRKPRSGSVRAIVAFDIYVVAIAALWSKVRRIPLIYYPQDSNRAISRYWKEAGYRGGWLFHAVRSPLERLGLGRADLILVVSNSMIPEIVSQGVEPGRVRLCPLKRTLPEFRSASVEAWRRKLGLDGKVAVVFVGSFEYAPNVRALRYVSSNLAPRLAREDPRVLILVAGVGSEAYSSAEASNLRILGTVDDLDGLLYASHIGIAPMDVAGGTSGKIVDYILHGLTTLATPEATQGVEAAPSLVVVPLADFATQLLRLSATILEPPPKRSPSAVDGTYVSRYVDSDDIRKLGAEISEMAAR